MWMQYKYRSILNIMLYCEMVSKDKLLGLLPPFRDEWTMLHPDQGVHDIINEVLNAHEDFREDYDQIALFFDGRTVTEICDELYSFCKKNFQYIEETEDEQTVASPGAMLSRGKVDCKGFSNWIAGICSALSRMGKKINWKYRFASYSVTNKTPHHVFVVVDNDGEEIWVDPTPDSEQKVPVWQVDKKIKDMSLYKITGLNRVGIVSEDYTFESPMESGGMEVSPPIVPIEETFIATDEAESDADIPLDIQAEIKLLLDYGVIDVDGNVYEDRLIELYGMLPPEEYAKITAARYHLDQKVIGGFFKNIFRGIKKVGLAVPRNAYLSLVALNVFGTATKIAQAIQIEGGQQKLGDKWYKLGGNPEKLWNAVNSGAKKNRIMGIGIVPVAAPVAAANVAPWVAAAATIIAAMTPLINSLLRSQPKSTPIVEGYDPAMKYTTGTGDTDIVGWVKEHPLETAGAGLAAYLLLT